MTPHHHHAVTPDADRRRIGAALALILAFMAAEVVAGILAGSLALLSDAAHMLTDAAALALTLFAARLASRPASRSMTFGMGRAEILSALVNGATLAVLAAFIVFEAVRRLVDPPGVEGTVVVVVAVVGIAVNLVAVRLLASAERRSLNMEGSLRHVLTDLYAFVATAVAGVVVLTVGFERADPLASLVVAGLMLHAAYGLIRESGHVLLEGAPAGLEPDAIAGALLEQPRVVEVHDLHVWEVTSGFPAMSAHVLVERGDDCHGTRVALERMLAERFDLRHTTLQVEHARPPELLEIERMQR